jgi:hypothetical protein
MTESDIVPDVDRKFSAFGLKYAIPRISSDLSGWDSAWEKLLPTLSPIEDVYPILSKMWQRDPVGESLKNSVCYIQEMLVELWTKVEEMGRGVATFG